MNNRVLLADDDRDDAEIFEEALQKSCPSATFHRVENGIKLFQYLNDVQNSKPDIIFLDLNMPEMSGWQCLARLKNTDEHKNIPVIMYTTSSNPRDKEFARDLNAHGLITKPKNPKVLEKVLGLIICSLHSNEIRQVIQDAYLLTRDS